MRSLACLPLPLVSLLLAACPGENTGPRRYSEWRLVADGARRDAERPDAGATDRAAGERQDCVGCDDGNPCTTDLCNAGSCTHEPAGQLIYRHRNSVSEAHAYTPAGWQAGDFVQEGPAFRTLPQPGGSAVLIYELQGNGDFLLSLDATEGAQHGYAQWFQLGWGFAAKQTGTVPLYRLYNAGLGLHLASLTETEGVGAGGYALEGVTAHVCPP